ncbi:MAG TPA: SpaA isopeptide-forming pilin-related protein [Cryptosporangiaceae bacterium]|nr:SpaA isopeptide-forming pilin-related protein [Cryptosporangiaceae bacterium]
MDPTPITGRSSHTRGRVRAVGRRVVSLLTLGVLATSLGVAGVVGAAPASAANGTGYYTSANGVSGFCVDPGKGLPTSRHFVKGNKYGNDRTKVLSWFATHYGPKGSNPGGGSAYPGDVVVKGLPANGNPTSVTTAIGRDAVLSEGGNPIHGSDTEFAKALLAFADKHQGPWDLKISLNSPGPYTPGTTYGGYLAISDKFGQRVHVKGIHVNATGQTNVSVDLGSHKTDTNGRLNFTFTPQGAGSFDAKFVTEDVAGRAPIYEDRDAPGAYQRLLSAERADSSAILRGATPTVQTGAFVVGKVGEGSFAGLPGAVFWVYDAAGRHVDTITTADGSGNLPIGVGVSTVPLPPGLYRIKEVTAPAGYFLPTNYAPDPADPFRGNQVKQINAGQFTNVLFADKPKPGSLTIGKIDASAATFVGLAGAVFEVKNAAGAVVATVTTDEQGIARVPDLAVGYYTIIETVAPPGFSLNADPQIQQVYPDRNTNALFADKRQPTVTTQISKQTAMVGDTITDDILVAGSGGYKGPVNWTLLGPVDANRDDSGALTCVGVDWTNAPTAATGTVDVNGDGTYTTTGYTVAVTGCYTYVELLVGNATTAPAGPSKPGLVNETVLVTQPGSAPPPASPTPGPLPVTGADVATVALVGLALIVLGGVVAVAARRRRRTLAG